MARVSGAFHTNGHHLAWDEEDQEDQVKPRGTAPFSPTALDYEQAKLAHEMVTLLLGRSPAHRSRALTAVLHKALPAVAQILSLAAEAHEAGREREAPRR